MSPVEELGLVSRTATDNQASVWTQESFEHDCPPGDRSPVVDNDWRFDNLCGSHLQSHLQNLPKTASDPPQQLLPWSMFREQNPSCVSAFTHQTSVFKDCLRAATVCNRKVSRPIFSWPGIPSGSQFKKDDPRLKTFSTQLVMPMRPFQTPEIKCLQKPVIGSTWYLHVNTDPRF